MRFQQIPEAAHPEQFEAQPLDFLRQARARHGDIFFIRRGAPLFSRIRNCPGALAVFGLEHQRAILSDVVTFSLPPSAIKEMGLPEALLTLNRSLHSTTGAEHMQQRRGVSELFRAEPIRQIRAGIEQSIRANQQQWRPASTTGLVALMRQLIFDVLSQALFGVLPPHLSDLPLLLRRYFELRRKVTSQSQLPSEPERAALVTAGLALDHQLRAFIGENQDPRGTSQSGLLRTLVGKNGISQFSGDQLVGHCNILFISSTEPLPMALAWLFLVLSQSRALREALRAEIAGGSLGAGEPPVLLNGVMHECLRLLTPNALMTRVTTQTAHLNGIELPANCEFLLSPFLSHRDPEIFADPDRFVPQRWERITPSPYIYFPFGAGGHSCIGKAFALDIMKLVTVSLLPKFDLLLAEDQSIDWSVNIFFSPDPDPTVVIHSVGSRESVTGGVLHGPVKDLMGLS